MEFLSKELQELIGQIATKNNITNYTVEQQKSVANDGDGYIGILEALSVIDKDSDKKLNLVAKKAPTNANLRKQFPVRTCFLREIYLYDKLIPEFLAFQAKHNIPKTFNSTTNIYGYVDDEFKEILFMENLKEKGFKLSNRQEPMDSNHLTIVITAYARWHAISHAMRRLEPDIFEKLTKRIEFNPVIKVVQENSPSGEPPGVPPDKIDALFAPLLKALEDRPKELVAIKKFREYDIQFMFTEDEKKDEYTVVVHADCWSANLMFKYADEENARVPTELCIIDWQVAMLSNPIYDLSYFFYINAGREDLNDYQRYLHMYHSALCENLTAFGLDAEKIYPFKLLEQQWQQFSKMGFGVTLVMLQQTLSTEKTHDFEQMAKEGKSVLDFSQRSNNEVSDLFKQRLGDLVEFLVKHNFI